MNLILLSSILMSLVINYFELVKGPKKAKAKTLDTIDGIDTTTMTREQLEIYAHKILEEIEREREERNFFQIERDKLRTFWEITRHQLDEAHATVRYFHHNSLYYLQNTYTEII